jgi:predicted RNase H-like HicB family nuclease
MNKVIQFNISFGENQYFAECVQLPIVTQGKTLDETVFNLKEALQLHLKGEDLSALGIDKQPVINVTIDIGELQHA